MKKRVFLTGATGCIGGWVAKNLVESGCEVFALSRAGTLPKLRLIMPDSEIAQIHIVTGDLLDATCLKKTVCENGIEAIIHLAALQMPFCKADPLQGARVNVEGTIGIFEAARAAGLRSVVYSSSTAVYGYPEDYPNGRFGSDSPLIPHSFYGVYKQANEWSARVYAEECGLSSIGIRPFVVYGPLRDQGMTSTPTAAMKAAAAGEPYEISYGGSFGFQYVDDTAKAFVRAAQLDAQGAEVYNLGGDTVTMDEVLAAIEAVCPESRGRITYRDQALPFPSQVNDDALIRRIGPVCETPLMEGVRRSIGIFRAAR